LRLALEPYTPIENGAPNENEDEAPPDSARATLFSSGAKGTAAASATPNKAHAIKCDLSSPICEGVWLVYVSKVNGKRTCGQVARVVELEASAGPARRHRLLMQNEDVIEPTDSIFPCKTNPVQATGVRGKAVASTPLSHYSLHRMAEFTNFESDPAAAPGKRTSSEAGLNTGSKAATARKPVNKKIKK
jgi:hypothetical protein